MYAVFQSGGKQYGVTRGQTVLLEKLDSDGLVDLDQVLMVRDGDVVEIGTPLLRGYKIIAEVLSQERGEKLRIVRFRRRKHFLRRKGHRQYLTRVRIVDIVPV